MVWILPGERPPYYSPSDSEKARLDVDACLHSDGFKRRGQPFGCGRPAEPEQMIEEILLDVEFAHRPQRRERVGIGNGVNEKLLEAGAEFAGDGALLDQLLDEGN